MFIFFLGGEGGSRTPIYDGDSVTFMFDQERIEGKLKSAGQMLIAGDNATVQVTLDIATVLHVGQSFYLFQDDHVIGTGMITQLEAS